VLADAVRAHGQRDVRFTPDLEELPAVLAKALEPGDLLITLGAGNISALGPRVLRALAGESS